jgi:hypothetical protein
MEGKYVCFRTDNLDDNMDMRINIYCLAVIFAIIGYPAIAKDSMKTYNYYHRNKDGTFILEIIDETNLPVPLHRQNVLYTNNNVKSVTGFYYGTDKIKFIDEIKENKITKSIYFDDNGKEISVWHYDYSDDGLLNISVSTSFYSDRYIGDLKCEGRFLFERDTNGKNFNFTYEVFLDVYYNYGALKESNRNFAKGLLDENYKPIFFTWHETVIQMPNLPDGRIARRSQSDIINKNIYETVFSYNYQDGLLEKAITTNDKGILFETLARSNIDGGYSVVNEKYENGKLVTCVVQEFKDNFYIERSFMMDDDKDDNTTESVIHITKIKDDLILFYNNNDTVEAILSNDELIINNYEGILINGRKQKYARSLFVPIYIFDINRIFLLPLMPTSVEYKIYSSEYTNIEIKSEDKIKFSHEE